MFIKYSVSLSKEQCIVNCSTPLFARVDLEKKEQCWSKVQRAEIILLWQYRLFIADTHLFSCSPIENFDIPAPRNGKARANCGSKPGRFETLNRSFSHELGSERVSERVSEWMSAAERESEASSVEQANEWAARANEWTDDWEAQCLRLDSWLFWTTVCRVLSKVKWVCGEMKGRESISRE